MPGTYPSLVARIVSVAANGPARVYVPVESAVTDSPARGPSTISTLAPASGLNAVSDTLPLRPGGPTTEGGEVACGTGDGAEGADRPWTSGLKVYPRPRARPRRTQAM